jgi:enamine deaminase RidA (YjgF/YER057c/UK114 family)
MRKKVFPWAGRECIALSAESRPLASVAEDTRDLYRRFDEELRGLGLSLENTLRSRIWASDREARHQATAERSRILTGKAKAASSSLIAPEHFDSRARVALDLIAIRPSHAGAERTPVEFTPSRNYLHYLCYDSLVAFSGVTSDGDSLAQQFPEILGQIGDSLAGCGAAWDKVVQVSFFLHQSQKLADLKALLEGERTPQIPLLEYYFVAGYAGERSLLEVEVTARMD